MSEKHTPLPWHVEKHAFSGGLPAIRGGQHDIADIRWNGNNEKWGEANARLIVRAVNAHDQLVGLLQDCRAFMGDEYRAAQSDNPLWGLDGVGARLYQQVRALLAELEASDV